MQDGIRDPHLADVVQGRGALDELAPVFVHAQQLAEQLGVECHPLDVQAGLLGAALHQLADAVDDLALIVADDLVEPDVLQRHYDVLGEQAEQAGIHLAEGASGLDVEQQVVTGVLAIEHHLVAVVDVGTLVHGAAQYGWRLTEAQGRALAEQRFQHLIPYLVGQMLHVVDLGLFQIEQGAELGLRPFDELAQGALLEDPLGGFDDLLQPLAIALQGANVPVGSQAGAQQGA